ncbi:MAG: tRNA (adenosine(37)-N6)-dimethylallyltransferase MiaA, partial [Oscillospiraceae bacterium]|nr:tRNA (adenosine(37)-N6)-dimethylallyltransferase MiaA [Oscillospiraceae bacterium]
MTPQIVVVTGPTATGKTRLGVELAQRLGGEIVSADSMQVYRGFDIGTAKVTAAETQGVPHHMIDVADPREDYSVSRYANDATVAAQGIIERGHVPIIVGGTGLYIDALIRGTDFAPVGDTETRAQIETQYDTQGGEKTLEHLRTVDPETASRLHPNDRRRIVRALEIHALTGRTMSEYDAETRARAPQFDALMLALT